jgi:hypothetical protein
MRSKLRESHVFDVHARIHQRDYGRKLALAIHSQQQEHTSPPDDFDTFSCSRDIQPPGQLS